MVNEILEKIFYEKIEENPDEEGILNEDKKIIDWDFENLKNEFEKIKTKKIRNKNT
jgi:hypothetical protein